MELKQTLIKDTKVTKIQEPTGNGLTKPFKIKTPTTNLDQRKLHPQCCVTAKTKKKLDTFWYKLENMHLLVTLKTNLTLRIFILEINFLNNEGKTGVLKTSCVCPPYQHNI